MMKKMIPLCLLAITGTALSAQPKILIGIHAGPHARYHTPITVRLPAPLSRQASYEVVNPQTGRRAPAQLLDSGTLVFILPDSLPPGGNASYRVRSLPSGSPAPDAVAITEKPTGIGISVHRKPVLFYHTAEAAPPPGRPDYYKKSGFIHPLYSPGGQILTDDFPLGHMHQHGIFMAWVHTTFRNQFVDFWNQPLQTGTVAHARVLGYTQGPVAGQLKVELNHKSFRDGEILKEIWTITVYAFDKYFLFDLASVQTNITKDTLYLDQYRYGGMAYRGSRAWNHSDSAHFEDRWRILTSEGKDLSNADHTHARWVDASGTIGGVMTGLTIFCHPSDYRYPQTIRVHPDMPYWCYAPVVDGAFTLDPGKPYRSQYRYLVHEGDTDTTLIRTIEENWVDPPGISVQVR